LAGVIREQNLLSFEGDDHLVFGGQHEEVLEEIRIFYHDRQPKKVYEEKACSPL